MLVLGTHNAKKSIELQRLLRPRGVRVQTLADYDDAIDVEENGESFAENATLKATQQAVHLDRWVVGEDSGLCVDALDGAPGIFSARISGENATDKSNIQWVLERMKQVSRAGRTAHYVSHLTLSDPQGTVRADCEAICRGILREAPAGTHGFGYDPIFEIQELHRTFGELGPNVKAILSHRGRALRQFAALPIFAEIAEAAEAANRAD